MLPYCLENRSFGHTLKVRQAVVPGLKARRAMCACMQLHSHCCRAGAGRSCSPARSGRMPGRSPRAHYASVPGDAGSSSPLTRRAEVVIGSTGIREGIMLDTDFCVPVQVDGRSADWPPLLTQEVRTDSRVCSALCSYSLRPTDRSRCDPRARIVRRSPDRTGPPSQVLVLSDFVPPLEGARLSNAQVRACARCVAVAQLRCRSVRVWTHCASDCCT
jgi:hypothetical protein